MIITLQITSGQSQALGDSAQKSFDHKGGSFGRASHNTWVLPDESKTVSGQHGMVYFESGNFYLTDISTNGIFVNGSETPLGKGNVTALRDGDLLRFGEYEVKVSGSVAEAARMEESQNQQHPLANDSSPFDPAAIPQQSIPTQAKPEPVSLDDVPTGIESPHFDPLTAPLDATGAAGGSSGGSVASGPAKSMPNTSTPFASKRPVVPDAGYQHSSPMNDPFTNPAVSSDPALSTPTGDNQGSEIPENWDLTGFSNVSVDAGQLPDAGGKPSNYIPEDVPLFDEPEAAETSLSTAPSAPPKEPAPVVQKPADQPANPARAQPAAALSPALTTQSQAPHQAGSVDASYQAFMQGLGLQLDSLNPKQDSLQVMTTTGRLFREVVQGLMILLQARSELKSQFRMSATTIRPTENNPLKFSPNVDEALKALFADERSGYLQSDAALQEGIRDIRNHQMAMIAGMQSAFAALIQRLDPVKFSVENKEGGVKASLLSGGKKSRAWEQYSDYYDNVVNKSGNAFQMLFGDDFNAAYEEQLRILETSRQ